MIKSNPSSVCCCFTALERIESTVSLGLASIFSLAVDRNSLVSFNRARSSSSTSPDLMLLRRTSAIFAYTRSKTSSSLISSEKNITDFFAFKAAFVHIIANTDLPPPVEAPTVISCPGVNPEVYLFKEGNSVGIPCKPPEISLFSSEIFFLSARTSSKDLTYSSAVVTEESSFKTSACSDRKLCTSSIALEAVIPESYSKVESDSFRESLTFALILDSLTMLAITEGGLETEISSPSE